MNSKNNPRYLSIKILHQSAREREPVDTVMDQLLKEADLADSRDSHLIMALVYGVLRNQRYLDAVLSHYSRHPLKKMKNITIQTLRIGIYQLLFMDRIPSSAAVNETVKAFRNFRQPKWLVGFVNGLLRSLSRDGYRPDLWGERNWPQAVLLSHPDWLYERYEKRYGKERAKEICKSNNQPPCITLCLNLSTVTREDYMDILSSQNIRAIKGRFVKEAVILPEYSGLINQLPGYKDGWFIIQDEGAQLIGKMLAPFRGKSYLDACAGVGGKTIQLSYLLPPDFSLTALEPNKRRFNLLRENLERMGLSSAVRIFNRDLEKFRGQSTDNYNNILIDAPCSGLGVIRRHPDIRWNFPGGKTDLIPYQRNQLKLLEEATGLLAENGILVYATCSTEPEENEEVVKQFITDHPDFSIEAPELFKEYQHVIDEKGCLRIVPGNYNDGFFAARLVKK